MGIDALDLRYRLEETFDLRLSDDEFYGLFLLNGDPTAGQLNLLITHKLSATGRQDEPLVQERVWQCIADALLIEVTDIRLESRLLADLGLE